MVDLSDAKIGDILYLRCGLKGEIKRIERPSIAAYTVQFGSIWANALVFYKDGTFAARMPLFDVVRVQTKMEGR